MAEYSRHIPKAKKEQLIQESGEKCANPGCSVTRLEIHHIKHWAVYKSHDTEHMIAVCPSCHDACHNGKLKITEDELYAWKKIERDTNKIRGHIYAEHSESSKIWLGTVGIAQAKERRTKVFNLSELDTLEFSVDDGFLSVTTQLSDGNGKAIIRVKNNNITLNRDSDIIVEQHPGRFKITVPIERYYLPAYAIFQTRKQVKDFGHDGRIVALDLHVIKPGEIKIQGFWTSSRNAIVSTDDLLLFCRLGDLAPVSLKNGTLIYDGPVDLEVLGFQK